VTPEPRGGNPPVRIAETEFGMLNAIGLANPGREVFVRQALPRLVTTLQMPIWVSVGGFSAADYAETCAQLGRDDVAAIELNLSCPNVDEAPESAAEIVAACRAATLLPLYAKLSPAAWDLGATACAVEDAGADGLSLVNTTRGLALDARLHPQLARALGGYSGPALKPIALAAVYACRRATTLPIVGMGGVRNGRDALELIACGANHVALGTVLFADNDAPARVRAELAEEADRAGFADPADAFCAAHENALRLVARLAN
jgi:dihydroorotate dehydrogenase (NAD+) catalytic subunit